MSFPSPERFPGYTTRVLLAQPGDDGRGWVDLWGTPEGLADRLAAVDGPALEVERVGGGNSRIPFTLDRSLIRDVKPGPPLGELGYDTDEDPEDEDDSS